jgi:histidyl-tRNA synthetase
VPGVGFAFGVERVALALEAEGFALPEEKGPDLYLIPLLEEAVDEAFYVAETLRPRLRVEYALSPQKARQGTGGGPEAGGRLRRVFWGRRSLRRGSSP